MNKPITLLIFNIVINVGLAFAINWLFVDKTLYLQTYGAQITETRIEELFNSMRHLTPIGYAILPMVVIVRIFYTSIFLYIGIFISELKIEFRQLIKIALLADFVYVLSGLIKLITLIFFKQIYTLKDLQFQPFSVMELIDKKMVDPLFVYPLSLLNLFELGYILILARLLVKVINEANGERFVTIKKSLKLVILSYGSGVLILVLVVMFITLNLT
ncbi:hypothetical protein [Draconibacterium halophilum]|uniref:Yip1 domain-containing protein n=1 Tax=Draconibacterium halophilum TaxID=2706887 RepID=A0A6C0RK25_9BACT|nr:hypothetical protein [Draconibacterium halophilum]QIA09591.1 hypothetical protein G0Q07_18580 [Draconibacterium halophilum]